MCDRFMMEVAATMRTPPGGDDLPVHLVTTQPIITVAELYEMIQARKKEDGLYMQPPALGVHSVESMLVESGSVPATLEGMNCEPQNGRVSGQHSKNWRNGLQEEDDITLMLKAMEAPKVPNKVSNVRFPKKGRKPNAKHECERTITSIMDYLQGIETERIVFVRRIKNLGFGSSECLWAYFSKFFGAVEEVLVAHSRVQRKDTAKYPSETRMRPASIGFVVMHNREDASNIINGDRKHNIEGVTIEVETFKPRNLSCSTSGGDNGAAKSATGYLRRKTGIKLFQFGLSATRFTSMPTLDHSSLPDALYTSSLVWTSL